MVFNELKEYLYMLIGYVVRFNICILKLIIKAFGGLWSKYFVWKRAIFFHKYCKTWKQFALVLQKNAFYFRHVMIKPTFIF